MQLSLLFQTITDAMPTTQINFLRAIINEVKQFSSTETIIKYALGTSANVIRIKQALVEKEIIDIQVEKLEFLDPMYKHWLKKHYFLN